MEGTIRIAQGSDGTHVWIKHTQAEEQYDENLMHVGISGICWKRGNMCLPVPVSHILVCEASRAATISSRTTGEAYASDGEVEVVGELLAEVTGTSRDELSTSTTLIFVSTIRDLCIKHDHCCVAR